MNVSGLSVAGALGCAGCIGCTGCCTTGVRAVGMKVLTGFGVCLLGCGGGAGVLLDRVATRLPRPSLFKPSTPMTS